MVPFVRTAWELGDWIVEGLLFALREIPKRPVLNALITSYEARSSSAMMLRSERLIQIGIAALQPAFKRAQLAGQLRDGLDVNVLMEWILRMLWTYLQAPNTVDREDDAMRTILRSMLLPAVLRDEQINFKG